MATKNQFGLSRNIPTEVKRTVRRNSKFGCVICRAALYEYEHIEPEFTNAQLHDPNNICCLCGSCHSKVTRGHLSKASVKRAYDNIRNLPINQVQPPHGGLDMLTGCAELRIGGIRYAPFIQSIVRYYDVDVLRVEQGTDKSSGAIYGCFSNDGGKKVLQLLGDSWIAETDVADIEITSSRIAIRVDEKKDALRIRLEPPGVVVIEHLDMRIGDAHIIASENAYAVGRYIPDDQIAWVSASIVMNGVSSKTVAIEFTTSDRLLSRQASLTASRPGLTSANGQISIIGGLGCLCIPLGISIGSHCGAFHLSQQSIGIRPIDGIRKSISIDKELLFRYIGTGILDNTDI